jgi:hypothetical protein
MSVKIISEVVTRTTTVSLVVIIQHIYFRYLIDYEMFVERVFWQCRSVFLGTLLQQTLHDFKSMHRLNRYV